MTRLRVVADTRFRSPRPALATGVTDARPRDLGPFEQLGQLGRTVLAAGLDGIAVQAHDDGVDSLVATGDLLSVTDLITVTAEIQPLLTPIYTAKVSVTLERAAPGRLAWRVDPLRGWDGDHGGVAEFLHVARGVWNEHGAPPGSFDHAGGRYQVSGGGFGAPLAGRRFPTVETVGDDRDSLEFGAAHADVHLLGAAHDLPERVRRLRNLSADRGRTIDVATAQVVEPPAGEDALSAETCGRRLAQTLTELGDAGVDIVYLALSDVIGGTYWVAEHVVPLLTTPTLAGGRHG